MLWAVRINSWLIFMNASSSQAETHKLLVFVKYPLPGRVKTRLAKTIGEQTACDIYKSMAERLVQQLMSPHYELVVVACPYAPLERYQAWLGHSFSIIPQANGDLGERMAAAVEWAFEEGAQACVLLGTDCPGVDAQRVDQLFQELNKQPCLIGPAEDGGYWTLGLTRRATVNAWRSLFQKLSWSTEHVYRLTQERFQALGYGPSIVETRYDIDTESDYQRWLIETS